MNVTLRRTLLVVQLSLLAASAVAFVSCSRGSGPGSSPAAAATIYYCPMHPAQTADRPGDCPICQMRLVPLESSAGGGHVSPASPAGSRGAGPGSAPRPQGQTLYRSTMNPGEVSDRPGKDSMGMDMVPVGIGPGEATEEEGGTPPGWSAIQISPDRLQRIGVTFGQVVTKRAIGTMHTTGRVAFDETRIHHVHTKFRGWIDRVDVDYEGKLVERGDSLFTIYSPDVVATQEEFLSSLQARRDLGASPNPDLARGLDAMIEAARRRLELWDVDEEEIARLVRTREVQRTVTIHSRSQGIVVKKNVNHGMYVDPSVEEFSLADLSQVWVLADLYENEIAQVHEGQSAEIRFQAFPGREWRGRISYVQPTLDPATRTVKVRLEVPNRDRRLKPGMLANIDVKIDAGLRVVAPKDAVIQTGRQALVFLDLGEGHLLPRRIETGLVLDDDVEVLSGLSPGDRVVTSANFLVDSESRLRAAVADAASSTARNREAPIRRPLAAEGPAPPESAPRSSGGDRP